MEPKENQAHLVGPKFAVIHVSESPLEVLITRKLNNTRSIIIGVSKHHVTSRAEVVFQVLYKCHLA